MSNYFSANVICPFFNEFRKQSIVCEGVIDNTAIHIGFGDMTEFRAYRNKYCCKDYKNCKVYKMLMDKYK